MRLFGRMVAAQMVRESSMEPRMTKWLKHIAWTVWLVFNAAAFLVALLCLPLVWSWFYSIIDFGRYLAAHSPFEDFCWVVKSCILLLTAGMIMVIGCGRLQACLQRTRYRLFTSTVFRNTAVLRDFLSPDMWALVLILQLLSLGLSMLLPFTYICTFDTEPFWAGGGRLLAMEVFLQLYICGYLWIPLTSALSDARKAKRLAPEPPASDNRLGQLWNRLLVNTRGLLIFNCVLLGANILCWGFGLPWGTLVCLQEDFKTCRAHYTPLRITEDFILGASFKKERTLDSYLFSCRSRDPESLGYLLVNDVDVQGSTNTLRLALAFPKRGFNYGFEAHYVIDRDAQPQIIDFSIRAPKGVYTGGLTNGTFVFKSYRDMYNGGAQ